MAHEDKIKLYLFIKKHLYEDLEKSDIRELASGRFPNMTKEDFDQQFSEAFTSL